VSVADLVLTPTGLHFAGRRFACTIGRGGIRADKREGDGATPIGTHRIMGMYFRPDRLRAAVLPAWAQPIRLGDLWSDDVKDPSYNHLVRAPHTFSHEKMRRADPLYDLVMITDWNWPNAVPGRGSAIFLHSWRRVCYPTAGCVAFSRADLLWIAARVSLGARLIVRG
jgi:L,D-peptidoglycan transpeptidase YkuD (ErfK/YbiS/YcfS/YnhG family)